MLIAAAAATVTTATTATTAATSSGGSRFIFPIILLALVALWLIVVRPQRRKQREQQAMQTVLAVGDEVLTAGGVFGTVTEVGEDEVRVEIAPNVEIRLARRAIAAQLTEHEPQAGDEPDSDAESEPDPEPESEIPAVAESADGHPG